VAALSWKQSEYRCIGCGAEIADGLARHGAVLCHDCRSTMGVEAFVVSLRRRERARRFVRRLEGLRPGARAKRLG
jgi:hypothetical protein